ncbi:50S ribosomal protein L1 [Arsenophonus endosymbiont of Lipoptena cervi]|uniref:50S ribosomal protein L1 n=1 Tax=Arsenophonus endosymbiont of Lipoptena cervi TaxID=363258 RepID=UPI00376F27F3
MVKLTRRMRKIYEKIDINKDYDVNEAIALLKERATVKFVESVDVAVNLGIDARKSNQNIRGVTILPYGTGRSIRIAVFTQETNFKAAIDAGAEYIGTEDLVNKIKSGKINFDVVIASPDAMPIISQLGQVLGPKGLMPNLKDGTLTLNVVQAIQNIKSGQISYRNDKNGIVHVTIGKINFDDSKLKENLKSLLISLKKSKPSSAKGIYFKKISLSTTMGIGISVSQTGLIKLI